jgi:hypothetical protein
VLQLNAHSWPATGSSSPIQPQQQGDAQAVSLQCTNFIEDTTVMRWKPLRWQHDLRIACCLCCKTCEYLLLRTAAGGTYSLLCAVPPVETQHSSAMNLTPCKPQRRCAAANISAMCVCSQRAHARPCQCRMQGLLACRDSTQLAQALANCTCTCLHAACASMVSRPAHPSRSKCWYTSAADVQALIL